jgi:curli production assembly/transport component CsgG
MYSALGRAITLAILCGILGACTTSQTGSIGQDPEVMPSLPTTKRLKNVPAPSDKLTIAIYNFRDRTGQRKPDENVAALSTAVTQGGAAILVDAAFQAGGGDWFQVVERRGLDHLLRERKLIRATRDQYGNGKPLAPLKFSGLLFEGGIISYDTNQLTGGFGARLLDIGANTEYRADVVSVFLRAVSVKTGRVVQSVKVSKTLYSVKLQSNVFKFIGVDELLELEAGISSNEPTQVAVRQAIEAGVYSLIAEGAMNDLWSFDDPKAGQQFLQEYRQLKNGKPFAPAETETARQSDDPEADTASPF